jgi:UDP-2,4-diacetamido-2,4,6-trideoxy-beta-L-altropyranose hydrolase
MDTLLHTAPTGDMNVLIRADASVEIGSGHVMRCLTLAAELRSRGARVVFVCREMQGDLREFIAQQGLSVFTLPKAASAMESSSLYERWLGVPWKYDAEQTATLCRTFHPDWLIIDHYGLDARWHKHLRPLVRNICCIDDLANRTMDCDVLLDQNLTFIPTSRYEPHLPKQTKQLLGPHYALLRTEFHQQREFAAQRRRTRNGAVERLFVFFGGSDPTNATAKAVRALQILNHPNLAADILVGVSNPHRAEVEDLCVEVASTLPRVKFHVQVPNIADFMLQADLALGAGGSTTWERCCLGLPALAVIIADNQAEMTAAAAEQGVQFNLGWHYDLTPERIAQAIEHSLSHPELMMTTSQAAQNLVDGLGAPRVANVLCG